MTTFTNLKDMIKKNPLLIVFEGDCLVYMMFMESGWQNHDFSIRALVIRPQSVRLSSFMLICPCWLHVYICFPSKNTCAPVPIPLHFTVK